MFCDESGGGGGLDVEGEEVRGLVFVVGYVEEVEDFGVRGVGGLDCCVEGELEEGDVFKGEEVVGVELFWGGVDGVWVVVKVV